MTDRLNNKLSLSWRNIGQHSQQAIEWISEVRNTVSSVDNEADSLILALRRIRNKAKQLAVVATRPVAVGFFGLSQAGKSFLISALAADENGKLITQFDGQELDFIEHINPPGGGKEATGLVTRFARGIGKGKPGFPIELKIFSEIEIGKILLNSYFKDFDPEKQDYSCEQGKINELFKQLAAKADSSKAAISADDVVELQDYALENFKKSLAVLEANYWKRAANLAPQLGIAERAKLFSVLWGEIPELTQIYRQFAQTIARLDSVSRVFAPLEVLVTDKGGSLSQADSIMNVDMLERLNSPRDKQVKVLLETADGSSKEVTVSLAELAVLTAELVFPLIKDSKVKAVENVDLLDFPGYRGRLKAAKFNDVPDGNPASQLLLRGKVAYLFEKYTDNQEMSVLVMCTPSNAQIEVNDVGPVLERWVNKTQGVSAEQRGHIKAGLLWAITKFDLRIQADLTKSADMLSNAWGSGGLLKQTILERFGNYEWVKEWSNGKAFNNIFLVRKPGFAVPFLQMQGSVEKAIVAEHQEQLQLLQDTFVANAEVQNYVNDPAAAWQAMLQLNDGGMSRISDYLESVATLEVKQAMLTRQLNQLIEQSVEDRFSKWHQSDKAEEAAKKRKVAKLIQVEIAKKALLFGEFLDFLYLPENIIKSLYNDEEIAAVVASNNGADEADDLDLGLGAIFADESAAGPLELDKPTKPTNSKFSLNVFQSWLAHLNSLLTDSEVNKYFAFSATVLNGLLSELKTAATRLKLTDKISQIHQQYEAASIRKSDKEDRIVFAVNLAIKDFVAYLGVLDLAYAERQTSRLDAETKLFEFKDVAEHQNSPELTAKTKQFTQKYVVDWCMAFEELAIENSGFSEGREFSVAQNESLGQVLALFKQEKLAVDNVDK